MNINETNKQIEEFLSETEKEKRQIAEGGLSRIYTHLKDKNGTFAMLSAYRKSNTKQENDKATRDLTSDLAHARLGAVKLEGGWVESQDDGSLIPVTERSFFIPNITKEFAIELCKKYNQDAVLFKDDTGIKCYNQNGDIVQELKDELITDDNCADKLKDYFSRRLQGSNQGNYFGFDLKEFYLGVQNWKWGQFTINEYHNKETSNSYTRI